MKWSSQRQVEIDGRVEVGEELRKVEGAQLLEEEAEGDEHLLAVIPPHPAYLQCGAVEKLRLE